MSKYALMLAATLLLPQAAPVRAQARPALPDATGANVSEAANHVGGYTAWDEDFFYVAVQVNKPTLSGKNALPFSNPLEDDAVLIEIQTDNDHASSKPTSRTVIVSASAAGGAQLYTGAAKMPLFNGLSDIQARLGEITGSKVLTRQQQDTARAALFSKVLKFVVTPKGTRRASGSSLSGYTLEVAIPWADLGGRPAPGARIGFNVAAQSVGSGSPPVQSLSPQVRTLADIDNPSLWGELQFDASAQPSRAGLLYSPRLGALRPVIDGDIGRNEWNSLSGFGFGEVAGVASSAESVQRTQDARLRPAYTVVAPRRAVSLPVLPALNPVLPPHNAQTFAHTVLARYAYRYQADPRKAAPLNAVLRANGSSALAHHPLEGVGPWLSYDRADWHRGQLRELRRAGIDVILPEYRGDARSRQTYADMGLRVLAGALQNLRETGQDYPLAALYLDTTSLPEMFGGDKPDLKQVSTQAALYHMIRDFYRALPAPFRYAVTLNSTGASGGGHTAYPIFLSSAGAFKDFDGGFVSYLRARFAQDFDGADLLIVGGSDFKSKAALDGYFTETKEKGIAFDGSGLVKIASIGAGYDASYREYAPGDAQSAAPFLPRRNGDTYRQNWKAAIAQRPDWVMIDGWNDYDVAAEVAPTLETGYSASDITREYVRLYMGLNKRGAKFLAHDAPAVMQAGRAYMINARVQNTGVEAWNNDAAPVSPPASTLDAKPVGGKKGGKGKDADASGAKGVGSASKAGSVGKTQTGFGVPVMLAYRWLRGGAVVAEGETGFSLPNTTLAGQNALAEMTIITSGAGAAPLTAGAYTLELRVAEADRRGRVASAALGEGVAGSTLQIPVVVTAQNTTTSSPAYAATVLHSDLPAFLEAGGAYPTTVTLRNDGLQIWRRADGARVTLRLSRIAPAAAPESAPIETPLATPDATFELVSDVLPGQTVTARLTAAALDADGKPLPAWKQDDAWTYAARWEVAASKASDSAAQPGTLTAPMPFAVVDYDFGARFITDGTPLVLPADRRQPIRMAIQNNGPQIWKKEQVRIGYHWYYQDGSEVQWEDETTPLAQDVAPGKTLNDMLVWVTAPPYDGTYTLVWDVKVGDVWGSTLAATRPFDEVTHTIQVRNGRLIFVDLSKAFNVDGISDDDNPADGDLDGQGHTLPAALLPPFATGPTAASGIWLPDAKSGPDSGHRISFHWGDKQAKSKNFLACKGQRLELGKSGGKCGVLHILAASTGKDIIANLKLIFQEPTLQSEDLYTLAVSRWDQPPAHGEEVGFLSRRLHAPTGVQNNAVALYHYVVRIKEPRDLVALQLPNAPDIKIAAITLEK